jgi:phosphoglycolate phosphatase-like HAD superfamily hydrolase
MKPTRKVIVFDFDGVLADTAGDMLGFSQQVCAELGYPCQPTLADLDRLDPMSFDALGRQLGLPEPMIPEYKRLTLEKFASKPEPPEIFTGMAEVVHRAASLGPAGIVTGNHARLVARFLERYGLVDHIAGVIDVAAPGTRAEKIRRLAAEIGAPGSQVFVIGDSVSDVRAAREVCARSIAVTWGHQSAARLLALGPDHLVTTPDELYQILAQG